MTRNALSLTASSALALALATLAQGLTGCDEPEEPLEVADATLALQTAGECEQAFAERPFLVEAATERGWGPEEIAAVCAEVEEIAETYVDDETLTVMTAAGVGQLDGESLQGAYYVGVAAYDISAVKAWLGEVRASRAVRSCTRQARLDGDLDMGACVSDVSGASYPEPLFSETLSDSTLDDVADAAAGRALSVAVYREPGRGTVVAFLAGGFYVQSEPAYGAFIGCGSALGFEAVSEDAAEAAAAAFICVAAEY